MILKEEASNVQSTWYAVDLRPLLLSAGLPGLHTVVVLSDVDVHRHQSKQSLSIKYEV